MKYFSMLCALLLFTSAVELLVGCGLDEKGKKRGNVVYVSTEDAHPEEIAAEENSGSTPAEESPGLSPEEQLKAMPVHFGVRDFAQINATMEKLTGIPSTTAAIKTLYETDLITQLPSSNDMRGFIPSHQVGISKLATEYCDALMANTTLRAAVLVGFNFAAAPATALADAQATAISNALLEKFFGPQMDFQADRASTVADLKGLIKQLVASAPAATPAETLNIVKGACTAVLASSSVSTL